MDWPLAISRNREALERIVAVLFVMLGSRPLSVGFAATSPRTRGEVKAPALGLASHQKAETGGSLSTSPLRGEVSGAQPVTERGLRCQASAALTSPLRGEVAAKPTERGLRCQASAAAFTLPRRLYAAILLILRPAESAVRRLILLAAKGLVVMPRASRPFPVGLADFGNGNSSQTPSFALFDPLKHFPLEAFDNNALPHFAFHHGADALLQAPDPSPSDEPVNAAELFARLRAIRAALNDIPRQARRLARWQVRRDLLLQARRSTRLSIFRPGLPPGWRQRPVHAVDDVLKECHRLALHAASAPDSG